MCSEEIKKNEMIKITMKSQNFSSPSWVLLCFFFLFGFLVFLRISLKEVLYKESVHRNFPKFTGKNSSQSVFFDKVANKDLQILIKKRLCQMCFSVNFAKFAKSTFSYRTPAVATSLLHFLSSLLCYFFM